MTKLQRIAILGLPGVGKSSFINNFGDQYWSSDATPSGDNYRKRCPAKRFTILFPSLPKDETIERLVDCIVFDVPYLAKFPENSFEEWELEGGIGVRSADVYVLMYDVTNKASFDYVVKLQKEITQSFAQPINYQTFPFIKKRDKNTAISTGWIKMNHNRNPRFEGSTLRQFWATTRRKLGRPKAPENTCGLVGLITTVIEASRPLSACNSHCDLNSTNRTRQPTIVVVGNKRDLCSTLVREISPRETNQIFKMWKVFHFESSAKYGWNVSAIMRHVLETLLSINQTCK